MLSLLMEPVSMEGGYRIYGGLSRVRGVMIAVAVMGVCLMASGCDVADHVSIDLPVSVVYTNSPTSTWSSRPGSGSFSGPRGLGDGTALMVRIDTEALPKDTTPDDIGAAALAIPVRSQSMKAGSASFGIYMLEVDPARKQAAYYAGLVPEGAKPLSICSLNHDAGMETKNTYYGSYSIPKFDNAVKRMNFNITEAVKAWVGGTPNAGLKVLQRDAPHADGPFWGITDNPSRGEEGPRVVVWVKQPEQPPA